MIDIDFDRVRSLGLTPAAAQQALLSASLLMEGSLEPRLPLHLMRVTEVHRETMLLHDGSGEHRGRTLPRLIRALSDAGTALVVGDWVLASADPHGERWVHGRVPPQSHITRRDADGRRHPVVSNIDVALLVMGLDDDFNLRRLERYLALVQASHVLPVVVLTKADVLARTPGAIDARVSELQKRLPAAVDWFAVDGTDPETAQRLAVYLGAGQTLVLLGSSGAGKSTLTNTLIGHAAQDTGAVRQHDSRGKHTTTSRSLHRLPGGACVIDTPGLRALRPDVDEATLSASYSDVESLALRCRFRDCTHHDEPDCAVRAGIDPDRLRNYHKLLREARRDTPSQIERQQQLSVWKARSKANRERFRNRENGRSLP